MDRSSKLIVAGIGILGFVAAGTGIAIAGGNDDDATETPIRGADLERASAAALAHTGGGRVTGTEVDDEESYYEVEVTLDDGTQVDVQLDASFAVVGDKVDDEGTTTERSGTRTGPGRCLAEGGDRGRYGARRSGGARRRAICART